MKTELSLFKQIKLKKWLMEEASKLVVIKDPTELRLALTELAKEYFEQLYPNHDFQWTPISTTHFRVFGLCPNHSESAPSFNIYLHEQKMYYKCFGCGFVGTLPMGFDNFGNLIVGDDVVAKIELDMEDIVDQPKDPLLFNKQLVNKLFTPIKLLQSPYVKDLAIEYLNRQNFTLDIANRYQLHVCEEQSSVYYGYMIFPFYDIEGSLIFYNLRNLMFEYEVAPRPKYIGPSVNKKELMVFYRGVENIKTLFIVEGPADALAINKFRYSAMPIFGKFISDRQIELIKEKGFEFVYICLDKDVPAQVTISLKRRLQKAGLGAHVVYLPVKDPPMLANKQQLDELINLNSMTCIKNNFSRLFGGF